MVKSGTLYYWGELPPPLLVSPVIDILTGSTTAAADVTAHTAHTETPNCLFPADGTYIGTLAPRRANPYVHVSGAHPAAGCVVL
jgi:hypothetical protein